MSDLWWDDRSIGGRIALSWSRRRNRRLVGRRSYARRPVAYDTLVKGYADGLLRALMLLAQIGIGLAVAALATGLALFIAAQVR